MPFLSRQLGAAISGHHARALIAFTAAALVVAPTASSAPAVPAPASGAWIAGTPQEVRTGSRPGGVDVFDTSPRGRLATWSLTGPEGSAGRRVYAGLGDGGTLGQAHVLTADALSQPAFDDRGHGLVLTGVLGRPGLSRTSLAADGTPGRAQVVSRTSSYGQVDVDAAGNAVIAWLEASGPTSRDGGRAQRVRVSMRPAGGRFSSPLTLSRSGGSTLDDLDLSVAVGAGGRAVVALALSSYDGDRRALAWTGTVRKGFGSPHRLGDVLGRRSTVTSIITTGGRSLVVWGTQRGGEEPGSPWIVRAASQGRGSAKWSSTQTVDPGDQTGQATGYLQLVNGPGGTTTLAWDGTARRSNVAQIAQGDARGRFSGRQVLTTTGEITGLRARTDGSAVVGWTISTFQDEEPTATFTAVRPAGAGPFGAAEPVAGPAAPFFLPEGAAAFARVAAPAAPGGRPTITVVTRSNP